MRVAVGALASAEAVGDGREVAVGVGAGAVGDAAELVGDITGAASWAGLPQPMSAITANATSKAMRRDMLPSIHRVAPNHAAPLGILRGEGSPESRYVKRRPER
jgi:hypothetical protein